MNVLVYSGPQIPQSSLTNTLAALRHLLVPNYAVQPITLHALTTQPWQSSCALLVLPRIDDHDGHFMSAANKKRVGEFVEGGGAVLMLNADAADTPRSNAALGLGMSADGDCPLIFDREGNCYIMTEELDRMDPRVVDAAKAKTIYDTTEVVQFKGYSLNEDVSVVARAVEDATEEPAAGLVLRMCQGHIAFWGSSVEYSLTEASASSTIASSLAAEDIISSDKTRRKLLLATLSHLGLKFPQEREPKQTIARPLPQFLTSAPSKSSIIDTILNSIAAPESGAQLTTFKDANDEFHFHPFQESAALLQTTQTASDASASQPKHIVVYRDGCVPDKAQTPLFDVDAFYTALSDARRNEGLAPGGPSSADLEWGVGEALLYGEAVTSTQTMLDKNPRLLAALPVPLLSLASHQLAGRGRGTNTWVSPAGCLQFSLTLRIAVARYPTGKLVFVQYLFALAVVEACRTDSVLGAEVGKKVRIKWPNDLYAVTGPGKDDLRKVGGVLVNTSFSGGKVDIVIGCGLNILSPPPITSLSQLAPDARAKLSMERSAAAIMAKFEQMWGVFVQGKGSFAPFIDLYLDRWLHSDQLVTLTTTNPHTRVRIAGITLDYGLLRTVPERSGSSKYRSSDNDYIDLQPDGNSFDLMANLIKSKS